MSADVVAAGAVCWRRVDGDLNIVVVHREAQGDVSLPKGKVDTGETLPQTAAREIEEETGLKVPLGVPLGSVEYTLEGGRRKIVHYWASWVSDEALAASTFSANQEIAAVEWLSLGEAKKAVSYDRDREVLSRFETIINSGGEHTFAIIVVRHAKTVPPANWDGPDATRPLLHHGLLQAKSIAPTIAAFGPSKLISSTAIRCRATLEPLSALTGLPIKTSADISQDAYEAGTSTTERVVKRRLAASVTSVLCSHGPVIPHIVEAVARQTHSDVTTELSRSASLSTGEITVLHLAAQHPDLGIIAVETHSPFPRG